MAMSQQIFPKMSFPALNKQVCFKEISPIKNVKQKKLLN